MLTSDFDYTLPPELIASEPLPERSASRMMVVHRDTGVIEHRQFAELPQFTQDGDLFVFNDSRVMPARFYSNDGRLEILRLEEITRLHWRCMVRPGKKFHLGGKIMAGEAIGRVIEILENGERIIEWDAFVDEKIYGHLALPPYMGREDRAEDRERYQTVFAKDPGSIAAPTAGLHFTPEIVAQLPHAYVTLHVGVGTFQPVKVERLDEHVMHSERYSLSDETAAKIAEAKRVIAVGTTACRTLETSCGKAGSGDTSIFIYPGYEFKVVNALLTNFHLPKSTLIMLVSALAGRELILKAYEEAVCEKYRFYSYGDCMLIL
jgi:S-adenosylmethionine:tRNA ribosyltransferase-isomerase